MVDENPIADYEVAKIRIRECKESDRQAFVRLTEQLQDHLTRIDEMKKLRQQLSSGECYIERTLEKVKKDWSAR